MSHFIGLCFGDCWEDNLEQYYEGLEVEAYVAYTKDEAIDEVKRNHASSYEQAVIQLNKSDITESNRKYFNSIVDKGLFMSYEDAWKEVQYWGYQIDENENLLSTYNPDSRWDWYSIGGRWHSYLHLKELDDNGDRIRVDQATFGEIDWDYMIDNKVIPFCFVTEYGEWVENGKMGWWGMVSNETPSESWKETFKRYINSIKDTDCLVTAIDFHI